MDRLHECIYTKTQGSKQIQKTTTHKLAPMNMYKHYEYHTLTLHLWSIPTEESSPLVMITHTYTHTFMHHYTSNIVPLHLLGLMTNHHPSFGHQELIPTLMENRRPSGNRKEHKTPLTVRGQYTHTITMFIST